MFKSFKSSFVILLFIDHQTFARNEKKTIKFSIV